MPHPRLLALSLWAACGPEPGLDGARHGEPDIELLVSGLDFGSVEVGVDAPVSSTVEIFNRGDGRLTLDSVEVLDPEAPFTLTGPASWTIEPDSSTTLELLFDPRSHGRWETPLVIRSDDPVRPRADVMLEGAALAPSLAWAPGSWEPETWVGCEIHQTISIENHGNLNLSIQAVELISEGEDLFVSELEDLNGHLDGLVTLAPGQALGLGGLGFAPREEQRIGGELLIESDDPQRPEVIIPIEAESSIYGSEHDRWEVRIPTRVDVIWAVDRSDSMRDELEALPATIASLTHELAELGLDVQLAVTQHDSGCIQGDVPWVDGDTPTDDAIATLEAMIDLDGPDSSYAEAALTQLLNTLRATAGGGCNAGLLRETAVTHLIGLSDEAEQSDQSWSTLVELLQSFEAEPEDLIIHGIGGDYPSGCGDAAPYTGMYEAAVATGGEFLSICADWESQMPHLAGSVVRDPTRFPLSAEPLPDSIEVSVDGVLSGAWSYEEASNELVFDAASSPSDGQVVEASYLLQPSCG
jgi:hypothetical protein